MEINKTPIAFSFNDKFTIPAGVCITSLLTNAFPDTYYDIFIMHSSERLSPSNKSQILKLKESYKNCDFTFIDLKDSFKGMFEIRDISIDAYYRLAIPKYVTNYDRIIYVDIDVVFNGDLSHLIDFDLEDNSIGAVKMPIVNQYHKKHLLSLKLDESNYINSGFLLINLRKIREEDSFEKKIYPLLTKKFTFQDQDILNIVFQNDIKFLDESYNYNYDILKYKKPNIKAPIVIHYTGPKPWDVIRSFNDLWWEYYRKSIYFDIDSYMDFQKKNYIELYDHYKVINFLKKLGIYNLMTKFMKNK